jgi:ribosomal-protein-alanine N-acetyltransferase
MGDDVEITIRAANPGDLHEIVAIERLSFTGNFWNIESFAVYDCIIAQVFGETAGFLVSRELIGNTAGDGEREILNLAVHPQWRRRKIASALLKHELARGGAFFLEVRESNLAARKLYESLGFRVIGTRNQYYANPAETAIVMKRKE